MGKKHKKESKKRKHHSRSRSRSKSAEREVEKEKRKHHKRHHKEKKEKKIKRPKSDISSISDDEVEFVPMPAPPKISKDSPSPPPPPSISAASPPTTTRTEGGSLSISETNALRAKLGLKPLQVDEKPVASTLPNGAGAPKVEGGTDMGEFVHKPAEDLTNKKLSEKLRTKLAERKEKRQIEKKLLSVKTLGEESDSDDSAAAWVKKNRKLQKEKLLAERKAKELDEMDAEFGIGELVQEELKREKAVAYTSSDLRGLTVEHDIESFNEGRAVILTLKDKEVLDEEASDALVNVNMLDDERYKKNILNRKQKPFGYSAVDTGEIDMDEDGEKNVLSKYDEEIDGIKKSSFKLGENKALNKEVIKKKLMAKAKMTLESLELPELQVASDYFTEAEMKAKFKKPKKVKKIRKRPLKANDLLATVGDSTVPKDLGSRKAKPEGDVAVKNEPEDDDIMDVDDLPPPPEDLHNLKLEPAEEDTELELALQKARRLKQLEKRKEMAANVFKGVVKMEVDGVASSGEEGKEGGAIGSIVLNSTAEFCRTLGDIPTYGLSGNRDEEVQELLDFEKDIKEESKKNEDSADRGGWNDAEMDDKLVDIRQVEAPILDAEPDLGAGVAGALRLAMSKGYLEKETTNRPSAARFPHLQAQNYSIEDKAHVDSRDDEKFGRRERYMGPTSDFKEKDNYKPNIKLEYIDDEGHLLSAKEAFRYLSHKFHGKGPGKNKVEKRMKKGEQQVLMKQMSSTDTPLGTLQMLQQKQKETLSPFVVLSGNKQLSGPTSITKTKLAK